MVDFGGLTGKELDDICRLLDDRLTAGICDEDVCNDMVAVVRAVPELLDAYHAARREAELWEEKYKLYRASKKRK